MSEDGRFGWSQGTSGGVWSGPSPPKYGRREEGGGFEQEAVES